jgi:hypothetical protein
MHYTIKTSTVVALALLSELHVLRQQSAELKKFGRVVTKRAEADYADVSFQGDFTTKLVLPIKAISLWAQLLPDKSTKVDTEPCSVRLSNGGSEARFLSDDNRMPVVSMIVLNADSDHEYKIVGETADEKELADIKKTLSIRP